MIDQLVVDSSVAVKWVANEPYSAEARRILSDYQAGQITLLAPDLIHAEVGNIIWKKHTLQGIAEADAQQMLDAYRALPLAVIPIATLLDSAYRLAVAYRRTVYDMLYVALSTQMGCQFVTADERLVNAIGTAFPNIIWIARWP
jgi:predicted nucleic acid-binding protein